MPMNINPMQLIQMIKGGQNPQQLVMNMLEQQMQNTPMGANLLSLAKQNRSADIEQIARNICSQNGKDFDKEFNAFKQIQAKKLKELEEYMQELNADILEMIEGASQEEKQLLQKKIALLATKINV